MKAAQLVRFAEKEAIQINEIEKPAVTEGRVLVRVCEAGINPIDWKIREGLLHPNLPVTMGGDFSGVVEEVGPGVSGFQKGDEVYGQSAFFNGGSGSFAQYDLADPRTIALKPASIDHKKAGALPLSGVSALQALTEHMLLEEGQRILIHGGAGGIGSIAIQLAKHIGAYVATTVSPEDINYVRELGADEIIDYKHQRFEDLIRDYDAVYDTVGGETYERSFKVLRSGGIIVSMLEQPNMELMELYDVSAIGQFTKVNTDRLNMLSELVDNGVIQVHVDRVFPLDKADEALTYLETQHPKGKIEIEIE